MSQIQHDFDIANACEQQMELDISEIQACIESIEGINGGHNVDVNSVSN